MKDKVQFILFVSGFFLSCYGIYSAIQYSNIYWYSYFVLGSFFFFDYLDFKLKNTSTLRRLFTGEKTIFFIYMSYIVITLVLDKIYGLWIANNWIFPHFNFLEDVIHVIIIGYPFAFFSVYEMFMVFDTLISRIPVIKKTNRYVNSRSNFKSKSCLFLLILSATFLIFPILNFYINNNAYANKIVFFAALMNIFLFDYINYLISKNSILFNILSGNYKLIISLFITIVVAAFLHEVPNTFALEWVYQNIPFTQFKILDVNILVLTFGWIFLVIVPITLYRLIFFLVKKERLDY